MKIKYNFSLSQDWSEYGLDFTECVYEHRNLDMFQLLDIFDDFILFTPRDKTDDEGITYWLAQNERTLAKCGEGCVDTRTILLNTNLNYNLTDEA